MAGNGKKVAVAAGVIGTITAIVLATKAKAAPPPPPPGLANLYGIVTNIETGKPVGGAIVTIASITVTTNHAGYYEFLELVPGTYYMTIGKEGYNMSSRDITLHEGVNELNVSLVPIPKLANLLGVVTDAKTGFGLTGVSISILTPDRAEFIAGTTSKSNGPYEILGINPGNYLIVFEKAGYETATR